MSIEEAVNPIPNGISKDQNDHLDAPFTEDEVKTALFQMFPTKPPGPNDLPALFYQHFWHSDKDKVVERCLMSLNRGVFLRSLNHTNITLITKSDLPSMAADFRPISLCNVSYKIISKVLTNRLKLVLNSIISVSQNALVPGRLCRNVDTRCGEK